LRNQDPLAPRNLRRPERRLRRDEPSPSVRAGRCMVTRREAAREARSGLLIVRRGATSVHAGGCRWCRRWTAAFETTETVAQSVNQALGLIFASCTTEHERVSCAICGRRRSSER
jgi:hypothetical protein